MNAMSKLFDVSWGVFALSSAVAIACGVAIVAFGAPPVIIFLASWAMPLILVPLQHRAERR
jgi:hypothetical protein